VELANAHEAESQAANNLRTREQTIKQRLQLPAAAVVTVQSNLTIAPAKVDVTDAIRLASTLTPRMRQLRIATRENEIRLSETKGNDAFRMNLGLTYGREVQDPRFQNLWNDPTNSYTVSVNAVVPNWDWGERKHRIQAQRIDRLDVVPLKLSAAIVLRRARRDLLQRQSAHSVDQHALFAAEIDARVQSFKNSHNYP